MMTRLLLLLFLFPAGVSGQITGDQLKNTYEHIIYDETRFTIVSKNDSYLERNYKVRILNENAREYATLKLYYDKFQSIVSLKAQVVDENGKVIKKYSLKDCKDYATGSQHLANDSRAKILEIVQNHFPYTLEVSYKIKHQGSLFYPRWAPTSASRQWVEKSVFIVSDPQNIGIRYKSVNTGEPRKEAEGSGFRYTWEVNNIAPFLHEPFARPTSTIPLVTIAARDFEIEGYQGNMESWRDYGHWMNKLNNGKNNLTPQEISEIKAICDTIPSLRGKVKAVYQYVQRNTRYISIQLGIGGWQPFAASFVHQKKYGDCKALSFYTHSLLEALGIPSYYTLIRAGRDADPIWEDFSSPHFNHAILTVPIAQDTLWLECTSQTNPFGYLGTFTSSRHALMITPEGGRLIRTHEYQAEDNMQYTRVNLELQHNGDCLFKLGRDATGIQIETDDLEYIVYQPENERRKWILDNSSYGNLELSQYHIKPITGEVVPSTGYEVEGRLKNFCQVSGGRLFLTPYVFSELSYRLPSAQRQFPIDISYPFIDIDTIVVKLPENYSLENKFTPVELRNKYGEYSINLIHNNNGELCFFRRFCLKKGIHPIEEYPEFKKFMDLIFKHDRSRFVLVKGH